MTSGRAHWRPAYVGLGSNLHDPASQLQKAFTALAALPDAGFARCSSLYRSAPMGPSDQPDFVNAVAVLLTRLHAHELLGHLRSIENAQGRSRDTLHWGPRVLDLDLLVLGSMVFDDAELTLPHPGIAERNFVLLPLAELAPSLHVPGLGSVSKLLAALDADGPRIERIT